MVYDFCYTSIFAEKATSNAAVKLANVPSSTYSVILTSRALLRSPKRKIDFAASRKPTASMLSVNTKVTISTRSIYPIQAPARGMPCDCMSFDGVHLLMKMPMRIDVGFNTSI